MDEEISRKLVDELEKLERIKRIVKSFKFLFKTSCIRNITPKQPKKKLIGMKIRSGLKRVINRNINKIASNPVFTETVLLPVRF